MSNLSNMKSISQARAKFAWDCADNKSEDYNNLVGKIPTYIKTNGLLNTLAFLYSDRKNKQGVLTKKGEVLKNIREWLTDSNYGIIDSTSANTDKKFLEYLTNSQKTPIPVSNQVNARDLMQYTTEVLALFNWLRRFVKTD